MTLFIRFFLLKKNSLEVLLIDFVPLDSPGRLNEDSLEGGLGGLLVQDDVEDVAVALPNDLVRERVKVFAVNKREKMVDEK